MAAAASACQAGAAHSILSRGRPEADRPPAGGFGMRMTGVRVLSGPNLYGDSSGVVIGTELASLPPAGEPVALARTDRISAALAIPGLADEWATTAAHWRGAVPALPVPLAAALVTT